MVAEIEPTVICEKVGRVANSAAATKVVARRAKFVMRPP
jgi:hypothetical protein